MGNSPTTAHSGSDLGDFTRHSCTSCRKPKRTPLIGSSALVGATPPYQDVHKHATYEELVLLWQLQRSLRRGLTFVNGTERALGHLDPRNTRGFKLPYRRAPHPRHPFPYQIPHTHPLQPLRPGTRPYLGLYAMPSLLLGQDLGTSATVMTTRSTRATPMTKRRNPCRLLAPPNQTVLTRIQQQIQIWIRITMSLDQTGLKKKRPQMCLRQTLT